MGSPEKPIDVEMGDMDETKQLNPVPDVDVKGDGGDKVEEERFTGLKKEELLRISDKKSWVVARWVLFIIFWVVWIGMLAGAIIIVVKAPRCKEEPTPPWFQDTVVYQADVTKYATNFSGMADNVGYVRDMNFKTLTVCHANNPDDVAKVRNDDLEGLKKVIASSHDEEKKEKNIMVVVELRIDAMSTSSPKFVASATKQCADAPTGEDCNIFKWKANGTYAADETWVYDANRQMNYQTTSDGLAYLNYDDDQALVYLKSITKTWIGYGVDGFQIRDMAMLGTAQSEKVVAAMQKAFNETQEEIEDESQRKIIGLFLLSSDISKQSTLLPSQENANDTDDAAVAINTALSQNLTAQGIKDAIIAWRNASEPFIPAYAVNTMVMDTLTKRFGADKAAGLTLFSYTMPGVPIVRSGDEALLEDDTFVWDEGNVVNASAVNHKVLTEAGAIRVNEHRALRSLRWDDENSYFGIRNTNSSKVIAIERKWDKKPTVMSIFNPSEEVVYVKVDKKEGEKDGKIVVASDQREGEFKFDSATAMKPGLTLVVEIK